MSDEKPTKKLKRDVAEDSPTIELNEFVQSHVFQQEKDLSQKYSKSKPYAHSVIKNVFVEDFLRKVQHEIKRNSKVNFKESDLFRVYQSIDMANLTEQEHGESFPNVLLLRKALYSKEWMAMMERICGLPQNTLTGKVDCACNCHTAGCHLLCHDDVIGTRKISYILYLTELDWEASEGGALELYDRVLPPSNSTMNGSKPQTATSKAMAVPSSVPSNTLLPVFNRLAFFTVEPGTSFHAVQEVLGDRPRLSLQGWYHAAQVPPEIEAATLQQLKTAADLEPTFSPIAYPSGSDPQLSIADREYLSKYLDKTYLTEDALEDIRKRFEDESSVQLRGFLRQDWIEKINAAREKEEKTTNLAIGEDGYYEQGESSEWKLVGPAHKQRFLEYQANSTQELSTVGSILQHLKQNVLCSHQFQRFLAKITSLGLPLGERGLVRRFRRGLDYTVAHYGILTKKSVLDATLCFVAGEGKELDASAEDSSGPNEPCENDILWQSGDSGGFECYIAADDEDGNEQEPADEYNQDDDTELLSVSASNNTISLVFRDPGTMRFVKYVGSSAPSSRWDISMEYEVEDDDNDEDGGSEAKNEEEDAESDQETSF